MSYICHCTPERTCELCEAMLADMPAATAQELPVMVKVDPFGPEYGARLVAEAIVGQRIHGKCDAWEAAARMVADIAVAMLVMRQTLEYRIHTVPQWDVLAVLADMAEMHFHESLQRLQEYTDL